MSAIHHKSRDNARTPMQWDDGHAGGFTTGTPWIEVNSNYMEINAGNAIKDPDSIYNYYKQLIALRKNTKSSFMEPTGCCSQSIQRYMRILGH